MTDRRILTPVQKLQVLVRYSRCAMCGEKLGTLADTQFDHTGQLEMTGDNSLENFRPLHVDCHKAKSARDAADRAKTKRLAADHADFTEARRVMLAKPERVEPKRKMQSRGFAKRTRG